ncbi:spore germination lipoprotein GerD [Peribacillus sp. NPDC097206]|uniref:spore germination lipoprotein GerD n=1 Tax=unclassified Peribacillus TaxID=2675266 RepID=UPI0037F17F70
MKMGFTLFLASFLFFCTGCSQNGTSEGKMDYEETKKMVVDILKTDEGKKAIQDTIADDKTKTELIMNSDIIKKSIEETVTSDKGKEFWKKAFKDPEFTAAYAKALKEEHKRLLKDLMKDPQYRGMLIEVLQEPDLEKEMNKLLKTKEMRAVYKKTIIETMESPLVQAKMQESLDKAATKATEKAEKSKTEDKSKE